MFGTKMDQGSSLGSIYNICSPWNQFFHPPSGLYGSSQTLMKNKLKLINIKGWRERQTGLQKEKNLTHKKMENTKRKNTTRK